MGKKDIEDTLYRAKYGKNLLPLLLGNHLE